MCSWQPRSQCWDSELAGRIAAGRCAAGRGQLPSVQGNHLQEAPIELLVAEQPATAPTCALPPVHWSRTHTALGSQQLSSCTPTTGTAWGQQGFGTSPLILCSSCTSLHRGEAGKKLQGIPHCSSSHTAGGYHTISKQHCKEMSHQLSGNGLSSFFRPTCSPCRAGGLAGLVL